MTSITLGPCTLIHGDCLQAMPELPDKSVDLILCDLPYGTTACKWDTLIPFEPLWAHYKRLAKGAIVLTAAHPFSAKVVLSNVDWFRYELVFEKTRPIGFLYAKKRPLACHENILVFSEGWSTYNPQMTAGEPYDRGRCKSIKVEALKNGSVVKEHSRTPNVTGDRFPRSVLPAFKNADAEGKSIHPTQKPVALMEYLIRTYTNEGDTVLDNCFGSGTTAIACIRTGRKFIGHEQDEGYFKTAVERVRKELAQGQLL